MQNTHTYTQYTQCTIKTYLVINTHYTPYVQIYIMYTSIHSNNVKVQQIIHLQLIGCATDSCAKVQQIMHMQCRGCAFVWCPVIADVLVQCVRVVR